MLHICQVDLSLAKYNSPVAICLHLSRVCSYMLLLKIYPLTFPLGCKEARSIRLGLACLGNTPVEEFKGDEALGICLAICLAWPVTSWQRYSCILKTVSATSKKSPQDPATKMVETFRSSSRSRTRWRNGVILHSKGSLQDEFQDWVPSKL